MALLSHLQDKWQTTRFQVFRDYLAGVPVQHTAEALQISKVAVYKNIDEGLLATFAGVQAAISAQIDEALGVAHGI